MNYAEMSDDKINLHVFERLYGTIGEDRDMLRVWQQGKFQPCNSWADAGPLILKHTIGIEAEYEECCSECSDVFHTGYWEATSFDSFNKKDIYHRHKNPLRAAMILFLMMQEAK